MSNSFAKGKYRNKDPNFSLVSISGHRYANDMIKSVLER